jgi:hypothetical protein
MKWAFGLCLMLGALQAAPSAHVAFSSVDARINGPVIEISVVAQAFDLAHELDIDPPERLVDLPFLVQQQSAISRLVESELDVSVDGEALTPGTWSLPAVAPEQQLIRIRARYDARRQPGRITIASRLFAYDTAHQTLVNIYEADTLETQQILDAGRVRFEYFTGTRAGFRALAGRFSLAGVQRALSGYLALLFLLALVLLDGSPREILLIIGAFTLSYSLGLWAGALNWIALPLVLIAPGVALSVVYAGVDNVLVRGRRDVRVWIALGFGWAHGFDFATALNAIDRPVQRFGWAAASFNVGIEAGVLLAAGAAAALLSMSGALARRRIATAASITVAVIGIVSFVERVLPR